MAFPKSLSWLTLFIPIGLYVLLRIPTAKFLGYSIFLFYLGIYTVLA